MKFLYDLLKKRSGRKTSGTLSGFLLHASPEKKIRAFRDAAQKANKDQRETVEQYRKFNTKTAS